MYRAFDVYVSEPFGVLCQKVNISMLFVVRSSIISCFFGGYG